MKKKSSAPSEHFPWSARLLGYLGVIPFVALAFSFTTDYDASVLVDADSSLLLLGYAAIIISFIGAVHWGIALTRDVKPVARLYIYSVLPALIAWGWLFLPEIIALLGMAATIVLLYLFDRLLLKGLVPMGYLRMRLHLTLVVCGSLLMAAWMLARDV